MVNYPIESLPYHHYVFQFRMKQRKPEKHFQSNLFSANNGVYDYSAVVTDIKDRNLQDLLLFISGRSALENSIGKIKNNFALDLMQKAGMNSENSATAKNYCQCPLRDCLSKNLTLEMKLQHFRIFQKAKMLQNLKLAV